MLIRIDPGNVKVTEIEFLTVAGEDKNPMSIDILSLFRQHMEDTLSPIIKKSPLPLNILYI